MIQIPVSLLSNSPCNSLNRIEIRLLQLKQFEITLDSFLSTWFWNHYVSALD